MRPIVVTSKEFDDQLLETYDRLGLVPGMLEALAGVVERRWWPTDVTFADAAAMAGAKAIAEAGIDPKAIGLLIDTSVCRDHLEPSAAVDVHDQLGLGTACVNFDLGNACLGFMNGMQLAAMMIDTGQVDYALIVDGEGSRRAPAVDDRPAPASGHDQGGRHGELRLPDPRVGRRGDGPRSGLEPSRGPSLRRWGLPGRDQAQQALRRRSRLACAPTPGACSMRGSCWPSTRGATPPRCSTGATSMPT